MTTPPAPPASRAERIAPWVAGATLALPVLVARYPPMADLPLHEAVVGLLRHWSDPSFAPRGLYQLNLGQPNQLFYALALLLSYVVSTGTAMKLVVAVTLWLMPVAAARFADHLGVTRWTALIVAPIGLGWMFFWGLLANLIGFDLFLFALPALDRFCARPTRRGLAVACGWIVLLHFAHDLIAIVAGGALVLFTLLAWRGWRENVARLLPAGLIVAIAEGSRMLEWRIANRHHLEAAAYSYSTIAHKIIALPGVLFAGYDAWIRDAILAVCLLPMTLFAIERWQHRSRAPRPWRERAHALRFELLAASLVALYFAAPTTLAGTTLIYHRFLPPAWALLTVVVATRAKLDRPWRLPRLLTLVIPITPLLVAWPRFADSDRVYGELDEVIAHMEKGSASIVLELGPTDVYELYQPITGGGHVVAMVGGRGFHDFTSSPAAPVVQRPDRQWIEVFERCDGDSYRFVPEHDLRMFRYVILHTTDLGISEVGRVALEPEARPVVRRGEWTLLESTLPLIPVDAPEPPLATPAPASLNKRATELVRKVRKSQKE